MSKLIVYLVSVFVLGPITALVETATASKLWSWFVRPQYGNGPTYASWYGGIAILTMVFVVNNLGRAQDESFKDGSAITRTAVLQVIICLMCAFILLGAFITGNIVGWL